MAVASVDPSDPPPDRDSVAVGRRAWRTIVVALLVGAAWVLVYACFRAVFPDGRFGQSAYLYRDDALISLSHARGLIDVGTASIGVSGSRVEGFSSPLQFLLASVYYRLGGSDAHEYLDAQVVVATFGLGVSVYAVLRLAPPGRPRLASVATAAVAASILFTIYPVFAWHSSGMENSLTNALVIATVACIAGAADRGRGLVLAGVVAGFLSVTRAEFVAHAAPLVLVGAVGVFARWRSWRRVAALVLPAVGLWGFVQLMRVGYFGSLTPNSGTAQRVDVGRSLEVWRGVVWPLLAIPIVVVIVRWRSEQTWSSVARQWWFWLLVAGSVQACVFLGGRADEPLPGLDALDVAARVLGLWWWLLAAGALGVLALWRDKVRLVHVLLAVPVVTGIAHIPVFGPARLAGERVVTFVAVPLVVLLAALVVAIDWRTLVAGGRADKAFLLLGGALLLLAVNGLWSNRDNWNRQFGLCCDQAPLSARILERVDAVQRATGLPSPMVANADLGFLSLQKRVNFTDLGLLGDPLLTRVWNRSTDRGRPEVITDYLDHYATPDVVEAHGVWSCQYVDWLSSDDFKKRYRKVWDDGWSSQFLESYCPAAASVGGGIWVRDDYNTDAGQAEIALSRALARHPSASRVKTALRSCRPAAEPWACQYVTRSVYRNLRAFADAGALDRTKALFQGTSGSYDRAVLSSRDRGDWYSAAARYLFSARAR